MVVVVVVVGGFGRDRRFDSFDDGGGILSNEKFNGSLSVNNTLLYNGSSVDDGNDGRTRVLRFGPMEKEWNCFPFLKAG